MSLVNEVARKLSELEVYLLNYILEMQFLTADQIAKVFVVQDINEVLRRLSSAGYLYRYECKYINKEILLGTEMARLAVVGMFPNKTIPRLGNDLTGVRRKHLYHLNELRIRFEHLGFISHWVSAAQLEEISLIRDKFEVVPDAVCIKKNGKGYFLELVLSLSDLVKFKKRIEEYKKTILDPVIEDAGIEGVIFLCTVKEQVDCIKKLIPEDINFVSVFPYKKYFMRKPTGGRRAYAPAPEGAEEYIQ